MKKITVRDIMAPCLATIRPEDSLKTVAKLLRDTKLDGLPVIDSKDQLVGIMTKANLYDALISLKGPKTPITDFFVKDIHTFSDNMPYHEAAEVIRGCRAGSAVVLNDEGHLVGIVSKSDWIMAMFRHEGHLRNHLQAIYDSMHNGLIALDQDRLISMVNRATEKSLGVTASQVIKKPIHILFPDLDVNLVMDKGKTVVGARILQGEKSFLCNITPIIDEGSSTLKEVIGAIIVFQDMTDLERVVSNLEFVTKLNDTLQSVLDIAYDGIITVDDKANVTMVSRSMENFLQLSSQEMIGKPVTQFIENSGLPEVIKTGKPQKNKLHTVNGKSYVVSLIPTVNNNKVIGAVGKIVFKDLASIKKLAQKLEERCREAKYYKKMATRSQSNGFCFDNIITADPKLIKIKEDARTIAPSNLNILITGESGTGKELFVQSIHRESGRNGRLINVNCAAIPESLLESEFFGYVGGAFSGAEQKGKSGKFTVADGGTLFLDEIANMSFSLQGKLLRVIQDGSFEPVGSNRTIQVDVRIIAATNQDIEKMVEEGKFRSDLYFRLNTVHLCIPPLIERRNDIKLLLKHFLKKYNTVFGTTIKGCSREVKDILFSHSWPGNVRELENMVERAINFAKKEIIEVQDLPLYLRDKTFGSLKKLEAIQKSNSSFQQQRKGLEKKIIQEALEQATGNKAKAARILGISRSWLYQKMNS
jgi:transcriptional regulator with PAS, ATPase and Fis domain